MGCVDRKRPFALCCLAPAAVAGASLGQGSGNGKVRLWDDRAFRSFGGFIFTFYDWCLKGPFWDVRSLLFNRNITKVINANHIWNTKNLIATLKKEKKKYLILIIFKCKYYKHCFQHVINITILYIFIFSF